MSSQASSRIVSPSAADPGAQAARPRARRLSLRLRIGGWTIAVFASTLTISTAAGIFLDRHAILRAQSEQSSALLVHLAQMPEFQGDEKVAASHLALIRDSLGGIGGRLELVPATRQAGAGLVARQQLSLGGGRFELRYFGDAERLQEVTQRSVVLHVLHGLMTLTILLSGMEWILRRKLIAPLQALSLQVNRMRDGGGWLTGKLPTTDAELAGLAAAVRNLGPKLEEQVHQWVNAERRSAVTLALSHIRRGLSGPLRNIGGLIGDIEARSLVAPSGRPKLRSILGNLDLIREALLIEQEVELAHTRWPGPPSVHGLPDGGPGDESSRHIERRSRSD